MEINYKFIVCDNHNNVVYSTNLSKNDPNHVLFLFTKEKGVRTIPDNYHVELLEVERYSAADME